MKCSLLVLSSYLDGELEAERRGELEAHLVGCARCRNGVGHLQEEIDRLRALARVHVSDSSAHELLLQVGLLQAGDPLPEARGPAAPPIPAGTPHWLTGTLGKALPWSAPRPPSPLVALGPEGDVELAGTRMPAAVSPTASPPTETPTAISPSTIAPTISTMATDPPPLEKVGDVDVVDDHDSRPADDDPGELSPWSPGSAVPQPAGADRIAAAATDVDAPSPVLPLDEGDVRHDRGEIGPPVLAPQRPSGLIARLRERIALQRALSRGNVADDDVQVVSGIGAPAWSRRSQTPGQSFEPRRGPDPSPLSEPHETDDDDPSTGIAPDPIVTTTLSSPTRIPVDVDWEDEFEPAPANLAPLHPPAAPTTRAEDDVEIPAYSRSVRFVGVGGPPRTIGVMATATALLMLIGLVIGRSSAPRSVGSPGAGPAPTLPAQSVNSAPSGALTNAPATGPATAQAVALTNVHTLGSGGTGWSVRGTRYGAHPGDYRIVLDLAGGTGSSPTATVGFRDPSTLYLVLDGTAAHNAPPLAAPGGPVSSVVLMQPSPHPDQSVYQISLVRQVTVTQMYVDSPLRLVVDIH